MEKSLDELEEIYQAAERACAEVEARLGRLPRPLGETDIAAASEAEVQALRELTRLRQSRDKARIARDDARRLRRTQPH